MRDWRKNTAVLAVSLLAASCGNRAQGATQKAYIIKDGVALGRIYSPREARRATRFAVKELREHLRKITAATLEESWRDASRWEGGIVLKLRDKEEWLGKETAQAFTIEQTVRPPVVTIAGNTNIAVLYGVYEYLDGLGVRWYSPGEIGTKIPRMASVEIAPGKKRSEPTFLLRSLDLSGTLRSHFGLWESEKLRDELFYEYTLWLLRNRLHFRRSINSPRRNWFSFNRPAYGGGHSLRRIAGLAPLFKDRAPADFSKNPERFPMVTRDFKKERVNTGGYQICFTNEDNIRDAIENTVRRHKEKEAEDNDLQETAAVSLALADCAGICECDECAKVAGEDPNSKDRLVWHFMNKVARGVDERLPGRSMMLYAPYYELSQPPPDVKIEPNIVAVSCRSYSWDQRSGQTEDDPFTPNYREWINNTQRAGAAQAAYDYVLMCMAPQPLDILDAVGEYRKLGYNHYHPEVMQRSEQTWPILWALARASWGSPKSPRQLMEGYCHDYYGRDNGELVLWLLEAMSANSRHMRRICYGNAKICAEMLPDELIKEARGKLKRAIRVAAKGNDRDRIQNFSDSIEVHFRVAEMFRAYADALNYRTPEKIREVRDMAVEFLRFWDGHDVAKLFSCGVLRIPTSILKVNFAAIEPKARKNSFDDRSILLRTIFFGEPAPGSVRNLVVLPEIWKLKLDPRAVGETENWAAPELDDGERNGWQEASTWNFIESQGYGSSRLIDGDFWYRLEFRAPDFPAGEKVLLRIGSLDDEGAVYLNGVKVADRQMGKDGHSWDRPFAVDVTEAIKPGQSNLLAVHGYDAEGAGGIWRPSALYTE